MYDVSCRLQLILSLHILHVYGMILWWAYLCHFQAQLAMDDLVHSPFLRPKLWQCTFEPDYMDTWESFLHLVSVNWPQHVLLAFMNRLDFIPISYPKRCKGVVAKRMKLKQTLWEGVCLANVEMLSLKDTTVSSIVLWFCKHLPSSHWSWLYVGECVIFCPVLFNLDCTIRWMHACMFGWMDSWTNADWAASCCWSHQRRLPQEISACLQVCCGVM